MGCCVCAGSCCHTGPHSYCDAHSGVNRSWPVPLVPYVTPPAPVVFPKCEHCYCDDAPGFAKHVRCCKCGGRMHEKFVTLKPPTP